MGSCTSRINPYACAPPCALSVLPDTAFNHMVAQHVTLRCKVLRVIDGDTFELGVRYNGGLSRVRARLYGIDTPESRPPKRYAHRDAEKAAAKEAKQFVQECIEGRVVTARFLHVGKYGRPLVSIQAPPRPSCVPSCCIPSCCIPSCCTGASPHRDLCQLLVDGGHGYRYEGGAKKAFHEWHPHIHRTSLLSH